MRVVTRVPVVVLRTVAAVEHVEVLRVLGVRAAGDLGVAVHERARVERREQPLVRIDDEAVRPLDARVAVADARHREPGAAVRAVDVHPHAEPLARVRHGSDVVDDAGVRGAARRDHREHAIEVLGGQVGEERIERVGAEASLLVGLDGHDVCVHRPPGCRDRRVRPAGGDDQSARAVVPPSRAVAPAPTRGDDQRAEVAGRATADEHAAGLRREPGEVGDVAQRLVLGVDRAGALQPRTGVDARRADHEIEQDRRLRRSRGDEAEEPRVVDADARGREHLLEDPQAPPRRRCRAR